MDFGNLYTDMLKVFRYLFSPRKYLLICMLTWVVALPVTVAGAKAEAILPDSLTVIKEGAFQGDKSLGTVRIPENVVSIGSRAYAETELKTIFIPPSVVDIAFDAFDDISTPMLIETTPGSYAVSFALMNNLDFRAETTCRALIIGQTNYPGIYKIDGPGKDIEKIPSILDGYNITTKTNLTADDILDAMMSTFSEATDEDISLLYYCGHGNKEDGSLVGIDISSRLTASRLRSALDSVRGRKIVIVDACYSGALIGRTIQSQEDDCIGSSDPASLFLTSFLANRSLRNSTIATQQYFVIVSSKGDEESWEASYGGIFTDAFVKSKMYGDKDSDGIITLQEAYQYTRESVKEVANAGGKTQSVQVYPEDCHWFGIFR